MSTTSKLFLNWKRKSESQNPGLSGPGQFCDKSTELQSQFIHP